MAIQGSLKTLRIPELLSFIQQLRKTGVLRIVSESEERSFLVQSGNLVFAATSDPRKRIGAILVRLGFLAEKDLAIGEHAEDTTELYFGERLVELGRLAQRDLERAVRTQILEIVEEVMDWEEGVFHFDESELPFSVPRGTPIPAQNVLLDATRRHDERKLVGRLFPDLRQAVARSERAEAVPLTPEEASLLGRIEGPRAIESLVLSAKEGAQAAAAHLRRLIEKGCVALIPSSKRTGDSAPSAVRLPVAPEVPGLLFRAFRLEGAGLGRIADIVASDPVLAAKTLRAAAERASATHPTNSIASALDRLGSFRVRNVLLPEALRGLFFPVDEPLAKQWAEHARLAAQVSKTFAEVAGYPYPQEAYLAALIQDLGAYALLSRHGDAYRELVSESARRRKHILDLELKAFGTTHPALGADLAEAWRFPKNLVHVIRNHHKAEGDPANMLLNIVAVASSGVVSSESGIGWVAGWEDQFDRALDLLNFPKRKALALLEPVRKPQPQRQSSAADFRKTPAL